MSQVKIRQFFLRSLFLAVLIIIPFLKIHAAEGLSEKRRILEKLAAFRKDLHSIRADVSQEKQLAVLKDKVQVDGFVTLAKPNLLRWEVSKPDRSLTVIDGETMTVYHPDLKEAQVYTLSENLIARNSISFFSAALEGDLYALEKRFNVEVISGNGEVRLRLVPISRVLARYLSSVTIHYDETNGLPRSFEVLTPKGDRTLTRLTNIRINQPVTAETFRVNLPPDAWIINKFDSEQ
jgi:outer membrane lipoprotein-sorting protein